LDLVSFDYENKKDKELTKLFLQSSNTKKYILGINKLTKAVLKYIKVDGIIDDFTRVQSSRKKDILQIEDIPKNSIILSTASGSPLEVIAKLNLMEYNHINYLALLKYSTLDLPKPMFMDDFEDDFKANKEQYQYTYDLLTDKKSKDIFCKVLNFKISYDYNFMDKFTNNHKGQYFDLEYLPKIKNIRFVDGGGYVGDTLPNIMRYYSDFEKIYLIEPNLLHINIAKRDFGHIKNIKFINCGLGASKSYKNNKNQNQNNCNHNYQANNINTIDNLIDEKIDFIKLDIEGAEQDAIKGAKQTIINYTPILAICIYHKANDWYKIPQLVLEINPNYDLYLRHYMEGIFETVLYFVPKSFSNVKFI
jgi:FkbM family methyltransferase